MKLVYGFGYGASGIRSSSPLDGKLLLLEGEGGGPTGSPQQLIIPTETYIEDAVKCPSEVAFLRTLTNDPDPGWSLLSKKDVPDDVIEEIIIIAQIPAYISLDGFEQEIRAEDLYKHMFSLSGQTEDWLIHAKKSHPRKHGTSYNCGCKPVSSD